MRDVVGRGLRAQPVNRLVPTITCRTSVHGHTSRRHQVAEGELQWWEEWWYPCAAPDGGMAVRLVFPRDPRLCVPTLTNVQDRLFVPSTRKPGTFPVRDLDGKRTWIEFLGLAHDYYESGRQDSCWISVGRTRRYSAQL